jgi:LysR family hydrogen peroxide-inducible transcriptional activator
MEMAQVRYFLALCDEKNFTRAARRCGVAQPSLTQSIKNLEFEVGGPLFHRSHKATELTKLGQTLKPYFAAIDRLTAKIKHGPKRPAPRRRTAANGFAHPLS